MPLPDQLTLALLAHLVGDYVLQSDWMASRKVKPAPGADYSHTESWAAALAHGATYTLPFVLITQHPLALLIIGGTHVLIDHYRLAKRVIWLRNYLAPRGDNVPWRIARTNHGMPPETPAGLATALMITADNTLHLVINASALAIFA